MKTYYTFTRPWWREAEKSDGSWPNNLVPFAGADRTVEATGLTREEAIEYCHDWNDSHDAGRYSVKCEFTEE